MKNPDEKAAFGEGYDERYQVRNADIQRALRTLGALIDEKVPEDWGWGLFLVPFGVNEAAPKGKGAVFWISNSERAGMIDAIKGWIEDNERRAKEKGHVDDPKSD